MLPVALFLAENNYRLTAAVITNRTNMDITYDVNGNDLKLVYSELRTIYAMELSRQIAHKLYIGFMYTGSSTGYKFDRGSDIENDLTKKLFEQLGITDNFISSIGLKLSVDSRD